MSETNNTVVPFNTKQLPAHLRATELSDATKALMGNSSGYRLSIKAGVWRLVSNGKEYNKLTERSLDVVVVAASPNVSRTFYMGEYDDEAQPTKPDCFSRDGKTPDPSGVAVQSANCDSCPQNAKGSGKGDSRACRFNQSLAVVLANDIGGNVLKFQVPAASIFGKGEGGDVPLREYVTQLAQIPVNIDTVVTRMTFDLDASAPKIFFKPLRYLSEDEYATAQTQGKTPDAKRAIEFTVHETDGAVRTTPVIAGKPPAAVKAAAPPPPPPEPEETEEEREQREFAEFQAAKRAKAAAANAPAANKTRSGKKAETAAPDAEPTVRPAAQPAPSPGRSNLASILDQWDKPNGQTDD